MYRSSILNGLTKSAFSWNPFTPEKTEGKVYDSRNDTESMSFLGGATPAGAKGWINRVLVGKDKYSSPAEQQKQEGRNFAGLMRQKTRTAQEDAYMGGLATQMTTNGGLQADATTAWKQYMARMNNQQRTDLADRLLAQQTAGQPAGMDSMKQGVYNTTIEKAKAVDNGALEGSLQKDIFTTSTGAGNALYLVAKKYGFDLSFFKNNPYIIPIAGTALLGLGAMAFGGSGGDDEEEKDPYEEQSKKMTKIMDKYLGQTSSTSYYRQMQG